MADDPTTESSLPASAPESPPAPAPRRKVYQPTLLPERRRRRASPWLVIPGLLIIFGAALSIIFSLAHRVRFVATANEIVYASDQGSPGTPHLWVSKIDGSGAHQLLFGPAADTDPVFSPSGSQIAFLSNRDSQVNQVFVVDADGKNVIQITRNSGAKSNPSWSPGNPGVLGYTAGGALYDAAISNEGGSSTDRLLPPPPSTQSAQDNGQSLYQGPTVTVPSYAWSPAKNGGLAAIEDVGTFQALAITPSISEAPTDVQQNAGRTVPLLAADQLSLGWNPDGTLLAVAALKVQGAPKPLSGLFLFESNGSAAPGPPPLMIGSATVGPQNPVFSPDGTQILTEAWNQPDLASRRRLGLALVPTGGNPGTPPHLIFRGDATGAQFSRDGSAIFFLAARPDGGSDLCRIAPDGTGFQRLSDGKANITSFSISPQAPAP